MARCIEERPDDTMEQPQKANGYQNKETWKPTKNPARGSLHTRLSQFVLAQEGEKVKSQSNDFKQT